MCQASVMSDTRDVDGLAAAEERLQHAVRANDAAALGAVLHDRLLATGPDGRVVGKQDDLSGYASGTFRVERFDELDRQLLVVGDTGVSLILARVLGSQREVPFDVRMRYTRTWSYEDGTWRVIAAHLSEAAA